MADALPLIKGDKVKTLDDDTVRPVRAVDGDYVWVGFGYGNIGYGYVLKRSVIIAVDQPRWIAGRTYMPDAANPKNGHCAPYIRLKVTHVDGDGIAHYVRTDASLSPGTLAVEDRRHFTEIVAKWEQGKFYTSPLDGRVFECIKVSRSGSAVLFCETAHKDPLVYRYEPDVRSDWTQANEEIEF
jgi:hypothetical protein